MAKINNTNIYNYKELPSLVDYLIGTSLNENKRTKNFRINSLIQLINGVNGVNNIQFLFSDGSNPDIDYNYEGAFFSNTNEGNPANFTQLILNKQALQPIDLSGLFNFLDTINNVVIKFENPSEPNTAFKFNVSNITEEENHFIFDVSIFEGFSYGEFLNENIYSFYFDVVKDQNSIDTILKYGIVTNENGFATIQENQFAWRLNKIDFLTSPFYSHVINPAVDGFYRTDIIVVNGSGNYQYVSGTENATEALEPPTPEGTLKAGVIQVYGDIISDPVVPVDLSGYVIKDEFDQLEDRVTDLEYPDAVLKTGDIIINDLDIFVASNAFAWRINQITTLNPFSFSTSLDPTTVNFVRYDILLANEDGTYSIRKGVEGEGSADIPAPYDETLLLATFYINGLVIEKVIIPPPTDISSLENRVTILENYTQPPKNGLTDEAIVIWSGEGFKYYVNYPSYYINSILYPAGSDEVTLPNGTSLVEPEKVFHLITLGTSGIGYAEGVPDENPVLPTIDENILIGLTSVLITAGETLPTNSGAKRVQIYDENVEWAVKKMDNGVTINPDYTGQAFKGVKSLQITNFGSGREHIVFDKPNPAFDNVNIVDYHTLSFRIYLPSNLSSNAAFNIWFERQTGSGGTIGKVSSILNFITGKYGYNENIKNTWQLVTIPLSIFSFTQSNFNSLWIRRESQDRHFLLDDIALTGPEQTIVTVPGTQNAITRIITNIGVVNATTDNDTILINGEEGTSIRSEGKKIIVSTKELKDEIDNIYQPNTLLSSVPPTRVGNTFTYPANGYSALINKTVRTNINEFQTIIGAATDNYKRVDLVYFKSDNTLNKVIGTESLTVAARPDIPNGTVGVPVSFINVFGSTIEAPTPITQEISIQDVFGTEKFKISDYIRFDGISMSPSQKLISIDPLVPLSAFLDSVNGNDTTGALENSKKPFKTIQAIFTALPITTGETYTIYITGGTINFTRQMERRNIKWVSYTNATFNFSTVTTDGTTLAPYLFFQGNGQSYTWTFENTNISFTSNRAFNFSRQFNLGVTFKGTINNLSWVSGFIYVDPNSDLKINTISSIGTTQFYGNGNQPEILPSNIEIGTLSITSNVNIIEVYKGTLYVKNIVKTNLGVVNNIQFGSPNLTTDDIVFRLGNVTHNGTITFYVKELIFEKCIVNNLTKFNFGRKNTGIPTIVSGEVIGTNFNDNTFFTNGCHFKNFKGRVGGATLGNGYYIFENSEITTDTVLTNRWSDTTLKEAIFFNGYNTIKQLTTGIGLIGTQAETIVEVNGTVKTNAKSFGENVISIYPTATFKEKLNEITVRSKRDLVNKLLDSNMNYIIDGVINDLLPTDRIIVPVGGLSLSGYGFDVSAIKALQANSIIFSSPVGGSGNLFLSNISLEASGGNSKVFQVTNAGAPTGGADAIELNVVNFDNCDSLGELINFRQGLWNNVGVFGVKDGLTLSGTWSGGFRSDLTIVRNFGIAATVSTLFKKGTDLLLKSRFWTDINADFKAAGSLSNFDAVNFATSNLYQIKGAQITRGGVIDDTQNYTGTITAFDNVSDWQGNNGIPNSNLHPYGITTDKMGVFANDVDAATGGVQVEQVYVESTTGYFKTRLV